MSSNNDVPDDPLLKPASERGFEPADAKREPVVVTDVAATEAQPAGDIVAEAEATKDDDKPAAADAILPAKKYDENDLRAAVGVRPRTSDGDGDDDLEDRPRSFRTILTIVGSVAVGVLIVILVILGRANSDNFALQCEAERAVALQGRAFPPWGYRPLDGDAWQPLRIAPETRCQSRETDDIRVLERWMLAMLLDEVNAQLAAHDPARLDETEALLKQSLLLTRPPLIAEPETLASDRLANHKEVERLLGDVTYWRAAAKLRDAAGVLSEAAKQFDSAAAQHPRHASDAAAWAAYTRKLSDQLRLGPAAGTPGVSPSAPSATPRAAAASAPTSEPPRTPAPTGTALPVEPVRPAAGEAPAPAPAAPAAVPASNVPSGGVLL